MKYESLGSRELELSGINCKQRDRYELVRIFILNEQCPIKTLKCYVHPGPMSYKIEPTKYREVVEQCKNLQGFSDPFSIAVDHKQSLGLILAPGAIRDISYDAPIYHGPYLVDRTYFGSAVSGRLPINVVTNSYRTELIEHHDLVVANESFLLDEARIDTKLEILQDLKFLSDIETLGVLPQEVHQDDYLCIQQFKESLIYDSVNKSYTVALPWRPNKNQLPTNQNIALWRMQSLQRKFLVARTFALRYSNKIQQLLTLDHMEEVVQGTPLGDRVHYLPHSAVLKEESTTTDFRIVMDGSSKASASDLSLNECLYTGPNLMGDMLQCLLSFRSFEFAATADLEKAFLHLNLRVQDRDCMRFYFPEEIFNPNSRMKITDLRRSYSEHLVHPICWEQY